MWAIHVNLVHISQQLPMENKHQTAVEDTKHEFNWYAQVVLPRDVPNVAILNCLGVTSDIEKTRSSG